MKKYILLFLIVAFPVFSFAQDVANSNKFIVNYGKIGSKTKGTIENKKDYQTDIVTNDFVKGESIELFDLIYMLLPDEEDEKSFVSWEKIEDIQAIKWDTTLKGKNIQHGELSLNTIGEKYKNPWYVYLEGNYEGLSIFDISYSWKPYEKIEQWNKDVLENLFNSKAIESRILESNDDDVTSWSALYEVKITGKKVFWIKIDTTSTGSRNDAYDIVGYLNKSDISKYNYEF